MDQDHNWLLFKQGNKDAFERIYREYIDSLYDYGKKFSLDTNLVEDCIQDMFIELWNKRLGLANVDNIKAYLFVVLRRRIIKSLRKNNTIPINEHIDSFNVELAIDTILVQSELNIEQGRKLEKAFKSLSKNQQQILYLKYYQDFDNKEIAEILKINYQSARNALNRAMIKLRNNLLFWFIILNVKFL